MLLAPNLYRHYLCVTGTSSSCNVTARRQNLNKTGCRAVLWFGIRIALRGAKNINLVYLRKPRRRAARTLLTLYTRTLKNSYAPATEHLSKNWRSRGTLPTRILPDAAPRAHGR